MELDMYHMMMKIEEYNSNNGGTFGYLPLMCKNSKAQLGALNAQSYVERMNSAANLVVTSNRTRLGDDVINKLVVMKMNK